MPKSRSLFFILIALCLLFGAYFYLRAPTVDVVRVRKGPAIQAVYATGTVEPSVMVPIAPRTAGRLVELHVDEGDTVKKGQVLAQLEDDDMRSTITELSAREVYARSEFERNRILRESRAIPEQVLEKSKSDWEAAKAAVARAEAQAGFMKLIAPEDGKVIRRDGEIGELIPANQVVLSLSCCAPLRISAEVDEEDIPLIQVGQRVLIQADAFPGRDFEGSVTSITPKGDAEARSFRVRVGFDSALPLMIGMTAETNIIVHEVADALLIPADSVYDGHVLVYDHGRLARRAVRVGVRGDSESEIVEGLAEGDIVVANGRLSLEGGERVTPRFLN